MRGSIVVILLSPKYKIWSWGYSGKTISAMMAERLFKSRWVRWYPAKWFVRVWWWWPKRHPWLDNPYNSYLLYYQYSTQAPLLFLNDITQLRHHLTQISLSSSLLKDAFPNLLRISFHISVSIINLFRISTWFLCQLFYIVVGLVVVWTKSIVNVVF